MALSNKQSEILTNFMRGEDPSYEFHGFTEIPGGEIIISVTKTFHPIGFRDFTQKQSVFVGKGGKTRTRAEFK